MDQISYYVRLIVGILGGGHPTRLTGGLLLGLIMKGGCDLAARSVPGNNIWSNINASPLWFFIALGLFIFFLPIFWGRTKLSEHNRAYIELVGKIIEKGKLTKTEERAAWRNLLEKMLDAFKPESTNIVDTEESMNEIIESNESED